jgi:hypothetical protein
MIRNCYIHSHINCVIDEMESEAAAPNLDSYFHLQFSRGSPLIIVLCICKNTSAHNFSTLILSVEDVLDRKNTAFNASFREC